MKNTSLLALVGILGLFLGGCPSSQNTEESQQVTQEPVASPSPVASPTQVPAFNGAIQLEKTPTQPYVAGLIPSTNPEQQRGEITKKLSDPFAPITVTPIVTIKTETNNSNLSTSTVTNPSSSATSTRAGSPRGTRVALNPKSPQTVRRTPPPPPEPTEARDVVVSGIVQLPTIPVAIIKAPGESTVRRVVPGSTLSNGQVLVKAIDTNPSNPMVVLEQYGQTVTKKLGEGVKPPTPENTQALITLD